MDVSSATADGLACLQCTRGREETEHSSLGDSSDFIERKRRSYKPLTKTGLKVMTE